MTSRSASTRSRARPPATPHGRPGSVSRVPRGRRRALRGRRGAGALLGAALAVGLAVGLAPLFGHAVKELALPLRHEDIIRQQAKAKRLDPALVAGVIYAESKFSDQTSRAGATGLMQLLPATAQFLARRSGGSAFEVKDLGTPQVNIAYGSYYLRYLLDRYGENEVLALAAYNGGETNVNRWRVAAAAQGHEFGADDIPFAETRAYVRRVLDARQGYRRTYKRELGLG